MTTPQHIIDMARAAGFQHDLGLLYVEDKDGICTHELERFYNLAVESARDEAIDAACKVAERWIAKEREECAKVCEALVNEENTDDYRNAAKWCAARIRARSK